MAAATVTGRQQNVVVGNLRYVGANSVAFAADADTWDTGLRAIRAIQLTPFGAASDDSFGFNISGGTLTLDAGAGVTFRGGVLGI